MKIFLPLLFLIISISGHSQIMQKAELISAKSDFIRVNTLKLKPVKKINLIEYFGADKDSIVLGERATLKWLIKSEGNVRVEVSENQQDYTLLSSSSSKEGALIISPTKTSYYRIIANESTKMFSLKVVEKKVSPIKKDSLIFKPEAIIEFFNASKTSIKAGEKVMLKWSVKNVPRVSLEIGESIEKSVYYKDYLNEDFEIVTPQKTTLYILRSGDVIKTVKIELAPK